MNQKATNEKRWSFKTTGKQFSQKRELIRYLRTLKNVKTGDLVIYTINDLHRLEYRVAIGKRGGIKLLPAKEFLYCVKCNTWFYIWEEIVKHAGRVHNRLFEYVFSRKIDTKPMAEQPGWTKKSSLEESKFSKLL